MKAAADQIKESANSAIQRTNEAEAKLETAKSEVKQLASTTIGKLNEEATKELKLLREQIESLRRGDQQLRNRINLLAARYPDSMTREEKDAASKELTDAINVETDENVKRMLQEKLKKELIPIPLK